MKLLTENKKIQISEGLNWHLKNQIPLYENVYRFGTKKYFQLFNEARRLYNKGLLEVSSSTDKWLMKTDIGKIGLYEGKVVMLDIPILIKEAEYQGRDVQLNKPQRSSGPKKYQVYVKNDSGNVIKVNFGDAKGGLSAKIKDPEARKAFADRHNCESKKDRTKAGYWSCNLPRYWKALGGGENMNTYW